MKQFLIITAAACLLAIGFVPARAQDPNKAPAVPAATADASRTTSNNAATGATATDMTPGASTPPDVPTPAPDTTMPEPDIPTPAPDATAPAPGTTGGTPAATIPTPGTLAPPPPVLDINNIYAPPAAQGAASNLPNISVIGTLNGMLANHGVDAIPNKQLQANEFETVIGDKIYPGVTGLLVLTVGGEHGSPVQAEEAYVSAEQIVPSIPLGARAGIVRLPFGKANPQHPHTLPYADTPAVLNDILGDFRGNGFEVVGLVPTHNNVFLQAQLGRWQSVGDDPEELNQGQLEPLGTTVSSFGNNPLTLGRLWGGTSLGENNEIEVGLSGVTGQAVNCGNNGSTINILGSDFTWRHYLPCEQRLEFLAEGMARREFDQTRGGYYLLGTYRPGHFYEFGSRYDWSQFLGDNSAHESYISVFATRYLTEMTLVRLQAKTGTNQCGQHVNEIIAQLIVGFGPHTHPLQ